MEVYCTIISAFVHVLTFHNNNPESNKHFKLKFTRKTIHKENYSHKIWKSIMSNEWFKDFRKLNPKVAVSKSEK